MPLLWHVLAGDPSRNRVPDEGLADLASAPFAVHGTMPERLLEHRAMRRAHDAVYDFATLECSASIPGSCGAPRHQDGDLSTLGPVDSDPHPKPTCSGTSRNLSCRYISLAAKVVRV